MKQPARSCDVPLDRATPCPDGLLSHARPARAAVRRTVVRSANSDSSAPTRSPRSSRGLRDLTRARPASRLSLWAASLCLSPAQSSAEAALSASTSTSASRPSSASAIASPDVAASGQHLQPAPERARPMAAAHSPGRRTPRPRPRCRLVPRLVRHGRRGPAEPARPVASRSGLRAVGPVEHTDEQSASGPGIRCRPRRRGLDPPSSRRGGAPARRLGSASASSTRRRARSIAASCATRCRSALSSRRAVARTRSGGDLGERARPAKTRWRAHGASQGAKGGSRRPCRGDSSFGTLLLSSDRSARRRRRTPTPPAAVGRPAPPSARRSTCPYSSCDHPPLSPSPAFPFPAPLGRALALPSRLGIRLPDLVQPPRRPLPARRRRRLRRRRGAQPSAVARRLQLRRPRRRCAPHAVALERQDRPARGARTRGGSRHRRARRRRAAASWAAESRRAARVGTCAARGAG